MTNISIPKINNTLQSQQLFAQAQLYLIGGVNSPVRAFKNVDRTPLFFQSGKDAYLIDVDNNHYIDYVGSWGTAILGHAHPNVVKAVQETASKGLSFGAPCELEIALAQKICHHIPTIEKIRFVNSGTEATMSAIRLARSFTQRTKLLKFAGNYHGHADSLLVKSGSGGLTFGVPSSPGVPPAVANDTYNATYNDIDSVAEIFEKHGKEIAAIIVEPVAANMNCILPIPGFLQNLRDICNHYHSLLIFDEVITGFRVGLNGAQGYYGIQPDLTTLGKIIGGGLPVGAYGGKQDIMAQLSPQGPVYQAGTLSGNPITMAAGLATLQVLEEPLFYPALAEKTQALSNGIQTIAQTTRIPMSTQSIGGLFGFTFNPIQPITLLSQLQQSNFSHFKQFFHGLLELGVYIAPSAYEAGFMSQAHGETQINHTLNAIAQVLTTLS